MSRLQRVGVLASGEGTNLQAILERVDGRGGVQVVAVGSNRAEARALERGAHAGVPTAAFTLEAYSAREARDEAMGDWLQSHGVELVVMAGYMQLVTPPFLARFPDRVINVHPALLPAFPGVRAVEQALAHGVKVFGVTIHFVDAGVDTGPIIFQRAVELPDATEPPEVLAALRPLEHDLLCDAVARFARGGVRRAPDNPRRIIVASD